MPVFGKYGSRLYLHQPSAAIPKKLLPMQWIADQWQEPLYCRNRIFHTLSNIRGSVSKIPSIMRKQPKKTDNPKGIRPFGLSAVVCLR